MTETTERMLDHDADGIRELDNDLPRWWVWLFIITIAWAVLYFLYYHVFGIGYLSRDEYLRELDPGYVRVQTRDDRFLGVLPRYHSVYFAPERDLLAGAPARPKAAAFVEMSREKDTAQYVALTDPSAIASGQGLYQAKCASCHGRFGEGGIGPNLTDDYWLHGAGITNVYKTIKYGVPAKGMLAWWMDLQPEQLQQVASYVMTLHGSNPPNAKGPQGDLVTP
jgi:cytochrome c oxidase cbb3-type subunit 3